MKAHSENSQFHQRRAFTLIELLIVIAIIAILALIAIPNFLEAQTRAKVARVKADMRSIATAIEAYFVDENSYPILNREDNNIGTKKHRARYAAFLWIEQIGNPSTNQYVNAKASWLTTPIAYLSSRPPLDPFPFLQTSGAISPTYYDQSYFFINFKSAADDVARGVYGAWSNAANGFVDFNPPFVAPVPVMLNGPDGDVHSCYWAMFSGGPDRGYSDPAVTEPDRAANMVLCTYSNGSWQRLLNGDSCDYDPTNGITSYGNIWRFQGE